MNIDSATMHANYWEARQKYQEYRTAIKLGKAQPGDEELRKAYRALSGGLKVIDVPLAIANAGLNAELLPKLAIARGDWDFVHTWVYDDGRYVFAKNPRSWSTRGDRQVVTHNVSVRMPGRPVDRNPAGKAQVPSVPPAHRPKGHLGKGGVLSGYRILFEAVWVRQPPKDPLLLRHIGGPFYAVLAEWDLTELEQSILRQQL